MISWLRKRQKIGAKKMTEQSELLINLKEISNYQEAFNFLKIFENKLFIYSPFVEKIYLDYNFIFPNKEHNNIAVLPNHHNVLAFVHNISSKYISNKPYISIMSSDIINDKGTTVKIVSSKNTIRSKYLKFDENILENVVDSLYNLHDHNFYPIVITDGIRSFHNNLPSIDIYHLNLEKLKEDGLISELDLNGIKNVLINGIKSIVQGD
jgi:hypothetical protein